MYAYGPVPSRRLGNSIGVSPIPAKVCSYSCVYCQLGRTSKLQIKRQRFFPKYDILRDIEAVVATSSADVITFAGDGEPTLCSDLGWLIRESKQEFGLPIAVITNGSLLFNEDVQEDLLAADIILPTLDAGNPDIFKRINRPYGSISFDNMLGGLTNFRKNYDGQLWLEVMLIKDVNDTNEQLILLRDTMMEIQPDKVFVMTPIRPPAEKWVECSGSDRIKAAEQMLSNVVAVANQEEGDFGVKEFRNATEAILEISARHPLRLEQARSIEQNFAETGVVDLLIKDKIISINRYRQSEYIKPEKPRRSQNTTSDYSMNLTIDRINCCTYRVIVKSVIQSREFRVILADSYYNSLARGRLSKEGLLDRCFRYFANNDLLDQLKSKFTLRDICKQFPEFEAGIRKTIIGDIGLIDAN